MKIADELRDQVSELTTAKKKQKDGAPGVKPENVGGVPDESAGAAEAVDRPASPESFGTAESRGKKEDARSAISVEMVPRGGPRAAFAESAPSPGFSNCCRPPAMMDLPEVHGPLRQRSEAASTQKSLEKESACSTEWEVVVGHGLRACVLTTRCCRIWHCSRP